MTSRDYIRWDGALAVLAGVSLYVLGLALGRQGPVDAAVGGGVVMLTATGIFMAVRHRAALLRPAAWFTAKPLAGACVDRTPCSRRRLMAGLLTDTGLGEALVVGLSFATGFWLTFMDAGAWALAIGSIKLGPAAAAIARHEDRAGRRYEVVRRPLRGLVELTARERPPAADDGSGGDGGRPP